MSVYRFARSHDKVRSFVAYYTCAVMSVRLRMECLKCVFLTSAGAFPIKKNNTGYDNNSLERVDHVADLEMKWSVGRPAWCVSILR